MATVGSLARRISFIAKLAAPVRIVNAASTRSYSVYPTSYIKPIFKKTEQDALRESGEALKIAHIPILPAYTSETSSEFHDSEVRKFTNYIMREGKKETARRVIDGTFENIKRMQLQRYHKSKSEDKANVLLDPIEIFHTAVLNATPVMELLKMKRGGVTYQVPVPILHKRQRFLAMNWLIRAAKEKQRTTEFEVSLAKELIDAAHNQGRVVRKKQELHKQCEANRAYAHYRWA